MAVPDTSSISPLLGSANKISILLPQRPSFDFVAAALGLKLSLDAAGKTSRVICADAMVVEFNRLVGVESIIRNFGSRNLVISFPGQTEHVDKVSYNLEAGELQLVITPKADAPNLDHGQLKFTAPAQKPDLVFTLGVASLRDLGPVYDEAHDSLSEVTIISISHTPHHEPYSPHLLHDHDAPSVSEIVAHVIDSLGLKFDPDSATNLLAGLEKATANFKSAKVSVSTFEAAAKLMRHGAKRHSDEISAADFPTGSIPVAPIEVQQLPGEAGPEPKELAPDQLPIEQPKTNGKKNAPPDWYEPKIYKGPMLP